MTNTGTIVVTAPQSVQVASSAGQTVLSWPRTDGDSLLEWTSGLNSIPWVVDTNGVTFGPLETSVTIENPGGFRFYRLRKL